MKAVGSWERIKGALLRGQPIQARAAWYSPDTNFLLVNDLKNPYTTPPDDFYLWVRSRQVGGRFLSWGRVAVRMSDFDFKAASLDGIGEDWPICYDELVPYYDKVEEFLKIFGTEDSIPNLPDGKYSVTAGLAKVEQQFKQKVESTWPNRKVVPWRYVSKDATPADASGKKRTTTPLAAAAKTGRLTLRPDAVVKQVNIDPATGRATGATFIDANTKQVHEVSANVVVLCASTIESVRLLLNSACSKYPDGVGNSSGVLGRYFMDQCPALLFGTVPGTDSGELVDGTSPEDNHGGIYIPKFVNIGDDGPRDFARGFNVQGMAGRIFVPEGHPALFGITGQGEMLPYHDNTVTLNRGKKDAWGIPVAHVDVTMRENEHKLLQCEVDSLREMVNEAGWNIDFLVSLLGIEAPNGLMPNASWFERFMFRKSYRKSMAIGASIHECGGARMGSDPAKSVLNAYNQCWDVPNLFVTDSSCFVTNGTCGPTLTTMALTTRACEYIAKEYQGAPAMPRAV
jgi:choline dehydrogenase-like flavoprotein